MVFFTCGNCGESIKKPSIAKHYMGKCRGPPNVTCVDCFKDFRGDEYEAHIKCVTEEERYAAKGFVPKPSSNKGEKKQQTWFEAVQNILDSDRKLNPDERELLSVLSAHENLPRKRAKFINFLMNAHRAYARRQDLVERVWNIIEEAGKAATANTANPARNNGTTNKEAEKKPEETNGVTNGENGEEKSSKKDKKRKNKEIIEEPDIEKPSKKSKRKSEDVQDDDSKKIKTEVKKNVVRDILEQEGGSLSLYKLTQALGKHCETEAGPEKAAKMLKKIQKQITVTADDSSITLNFDETNQ